MRMDDSACQGQPTHLQPFLPTSAVDAGTMSLETQMSQLQVDSAGKEKPAVHMSNTFHERIARGNNLTKMGNASNPRDTAMLIAAQVSIPVSLSIPAPTPATSVVDTAHSMCAPGQARSCVDCPTLQAVGPQATNQAVKAIAIARTFLKQSESTDSEPPPCS